MVELKEAAGVDCQPVPRVLLLKLLLIGLLVTEPEIVSILVSPGQIVVFEALLSILQPGKSAVLYKDIFATQPCPCWIEPLTKLKVIQPSALVEVKIVGEKTSGISLKGKTLLPDKCGALLPTSNGFEPLLNLCE